jgi:uncharacterized ParB-like nuclease family protein
MEILYLPIASIRVGKKQSAKVSQSKVLHHLEVLEDGGDLHPIDVHLLSDGSYTVAGNGRHRYFAYAMLGYSHIPAIVRNL